MNKHEADRIYLIGDIVDGWRLKKSRYWPSSHDDAVQMILKKAHLGAKVSYIPGNHDEFVRRYAGRRINGVEILDQTIHTTADGRRYLVTHGDQYDVVIQNAKWLAYLGDCFYEFALSTNTWLNWVRGRMGLKYWSLGAFAKRHVKSFVNIIGDFETVVAEEVRGQELDGVICGHIHHAISRETNGIGSKAAQRSSSTMTAPWRCCTGKSYRRSRSAIPGSPSTRNMTNKRREALR